MKRSFGIVVAAVVVSMAMAGLALANGPDLIEDPTSDSPIITVTPEGDIKIVIPNTDGSLPECPDESDDDGTTESGQPVPSLEETGDAGDEGNGDDGTVVEEDDGKCFKIPIDHPNDKDHHGAFVSSVAKGLHPSMLDGIEALDGVKKGHIMRLVAKGDYMIEPDASDDGDDPEELVEPKSNTKENKGKSEWARNKDKPNKGKKNG